METTNNKLKFLLIPLIFTCAVIFLLSLSIGDVNTPLKTVFKVLTGNGDALSRSVIIRIRLPRFLAAAAVGSMLAIAGLIMQTIFRNPLVDPYFLGISSAAELGISVAIMLGVSSTLFGISIMSIIAFSFSVILIFGIVKIARLKNFLESKIAIVLLGIAISYMLSAVNNFLIFYKKDIFIKSTFWALKGFNTANISEFLFAVPFLVAGSIYILLNAKKMNIYLSSDLTAHSLGINLSKFVPLMLAVSALIAAASVMIAGSISFIGLFTPHIGRLIAGEERKKLTIVTLLLGATLLPVFDLISRTVLPSQEIPINTITALIGAPFFIYLFVRSKNAQH